MSLYQCTVYFVMVL